MRAVLVPVKAFSQAKERLSSVLSPEERRTLAIDLAAKVISSAGATPVFVACDDATVADWAITVGAYVLWTPGLGLSGAVGAGVAHLATKNFTLATVAHADLALVESLESFGEEDVATIAPDRHLDGTNVISIPTSAGFQFSYGPGSYLRHRAEVERLGLPVRIIHDWSLAADVDTPQDLVLVRSELERRQHAAPVAHAV